MTSDQLAEQMLFDLIGMRPDDAAVTVDRGARRHTGAVPHVSEADKARMRRQAASLDDAATDDPGTLEQRKRLLDGINDMRERDGSAPFADEDEEPPELEFFRRARALGMARIHR